MTESNRDDAGPAADGGGSAAQTQAFAGLLSTVNQLYERVETLEQQLPTGGRSFAESDQPLVEWVDWLIKSYGLVELDDWQTIPPIRYELAGLMRAKTRDDGSPWWLTSWHDQLAQFLARVRQLRSNWAGHVSMQASPDEAFQAAFEPEPVAAEPITETEVDQ
jgi:uncharacterized protein YukE